MEEMEEVVEEEVVEEVKEVKEEEEVVEDRFCCSHFVFACILVRQKRLIGDDL